ncbi:hypothetical protein MOBT1_001241 [Malassezia obtusa]|uniref:peptidyl-tRNA hydrolase n=1 Tax=Malassezia obtusa TaxID=76774 RepID=A0AAF0DZR6_9BASI|nr:hypothetical protein MOBT1_001241 [Malassezia obtusa]
MSVAPRPVVRRTVLLVGLGNYTHPATRHSIGQYVLRPLMRAAIAHDRALREQLASRTFHGPTYAVPPAAEPCEFSSVRAARGWVASVSVLIDTLPPKGTVRRHAPEHYPFVHADVLLYIPKYLMNQNGYGVAAACDALGSVRVPDDVLLVHDELARAFGKVSYKAEGSAGGHNGVRSVQAMLRARGVAGDVARMRLGIGRPADGADVGAFVLGAMPPTWLAACAYPPEAPADGAPGVPLIDTLWKEVARWIAAPCIP